jgi:CRP/FNR family transcriptional regulator, cyclic AMP receptor protein
MEPSSQNAFPAIQPDDPRLQRFAIFSGLGPDELATLIRLTDTVSFDQGAKILQSGDHGHCLFILLSGSAAVHAPPPDHGVEFARLEAGDFFGEISLVDDGPRSADVVALEPCQLIRVTRITIGVLAGLQPAAAVQLLGSIGRELVKRLRATNLKYIDLLHRLHAQA